MEIIVVALVEEQMSSWKVNLPKLPIIIKYSAIGTRKYRAGYFFLGFLTSARTWFELRFKVEKSCEDEMKVEVVMVQKSKMVTSSLLSVQLVVVAYKEVMEVLVRCWSDGDVVPTSVLVIIQRFNSTDPTEDKEIELWVELKRLFEPDADHELWKSQKHVHDITWRLYDTCGVHHVSTKDGVDIYMMVEREYPLSRGVLT
ncbi:hypothetical protein Tco_0011553 [Tanacetum coccineum]